jgi:hypothetical protein
VSRCDTLSRLGLDDWLGVPGYGQSQLESVVQYEKTLYVANAVGDDGFRDRTLIEHFVRTSELSFEQPFTLLFRLLPGCKAALIWPGDHVLLDTLRQTTKVHPGWSILPCGTLHQLNIFHTLQGYAVVGEQRVRIVAGVEEYIFSTSSSWRTPRKVLPVTVPAVSNLSVPRVCTFSI